MSVSIGKVIGLEGVFQAKGLDGSIRQISNGDTIYVGDVVIGDRSNNSANNVVVSVMDGSDIIVLGQDKQLFDSSLSVEEFAKEEAVTKKDSILALLEKNGDIENIEDLETAAGVGATVESTENVEAVFTQANNASADISADLRDRIFEEELAVSRDDNYLLNTEVNPANTSISNDPLNLIVTPVSALTEDSVTAGTTVATSVASDEDGGAIIFTISDTTNYAIDPITGEVTLKAEGAAIVNSGADLPNFTVTATSSNSTSSQEIDPANTTLFNDAPTITVTATNNFTEDAPANTVGSVVATYTTNDSEGSAVTVTLSDTTNYALGTGTDAGKVLLTQAGLDLVNAGTDLPAFTLTPNDGTINGTAANVDPSVTPANDAPASTNDSIAILEDINNTINVYTLTISDFGTYNDEEGDAMSAVRVETLPNNGALYLDGVVLSAGAVVFVTDINSGKLTFNPTDHSDADSNFTFRVNDGSLWSSDSYTTTIYIEAVADAPALSVISNVTVSQEITLSNVTDTSSGFTVTAYSANGAISTISTHTGPDGFGVSGVASGADSELGYLNGVGSENIVVELNQDVTSVDVSFAWLSSSENATYIFYKGGVAVGSGTIFGGSDGVDPAITLKPDGGVLFDTIVFSAPRLGDDYLINSIAYDKTVQSTSGVIVADENTSVVLNISSALVDTDGSEALTVTINDIPSGFTFSDGANTFTADASNTSVDITNWNLSSLILTTSMLGATTTYTLNVVATAIESSNGSSASTVLPIEVTVNNNPNLMIVNDNIAQVDEAALSVGTNSVSSAEAVSGNILIDDILSGGTILSNVSIAGGSTVIDTSTNSATVTTAEGNKLVVNTLTGDYTYTLVNPVNHSILGNDVDIFTYTVTNPLGISSAANLTVTIVDDAPVINNATPILVSSPGLIDTNIIFTLDVSGSMDDIVTGTTTRFDIAKQALINTINTYAEQGEVNVNLTLFNGGAVSLGWKNEAESLDYLNKLTMNHDTNTILYNGAIITGLTDVQTNYEAALAVTPTTYSTNLPTADRTVSYFISDGAPTVENNEGKDVKWNVGTDAESGWLDSAYVTDWTSFINTNSINLTVIGVGTNLSAYYLDLVQVQVGETAIIVSDATQLSTVITSTIELAEGSLYSLDGSAGINFGADGGYISELVYNNVTFTYDSANPAQAITLSEGTMELDFETGNYIYTPTISSGDYISEEFNITMVDKDGDTHTDTLNLAIINETVVFDSTSNIDSGVGYDILLVESSVDFSLLTNEIKNIEEINLGNGAQDISLSLNDVMSITDEDNILYVTGDVEDSVSLKTTDNWSASATQSQAGFNEYTSTIDPTVKLQIQDDIEVKYS